MAWFKVDDQLAFHPKAATAGNAAMGLWVRAGSYASAHLTDGFIASAIALAMANECDADALVSVGLWDRVDGGYQFHGWDEWQPNAEEERIRREERSEKRRAAGRKGAEARWGKKSTNKSDSNRMASAMTNESDRNGKPMPPSPSPSPLSSNEESVATKRATQLPKTWTPTDKHAAIAAERNIDMDAEAEKFRDWCGATGRTYKDHDLAFNGWLRRATPDRSHQHRPNRDAASSEALVQAHFDMQAMGGPQ